MHNWRLVIKTRPSRPMVRPLAYQAQSAHLAHLSIELPRSHEENCRLIAFKKQGRTDGLTDTRSYRVPSSRLKQVILPSIHPSERRTDHRTHLKDPGGLHDTSRLAFGRRSQVRTDHPFILLSIRPFPKSPLSSLFLVHGNHRIYSIIAEKVRK